MEVYGTHIIHGAQGISAPHQTEKFSKSTEVDTQLSQPVKDEIDISNTARQVGPSADASATVGASDIRLDLVNEARAKIASGYYDAPEFLEMALDKMIQRNFG